jgi:phasin family protein
MTDKNPFAGFFAQNDFAKLFKDYQAAPFDMKTFFETQRKNMQAMTEAQQTAIEGMRSLAQRQSEIFTELLSENSSIAKSMIGEGTAEEKFAKNAHLFKTAYERSIKNMRELSDIVAKTSAEASNVINKRVTATMTEIQTAVEEKDSGAGRRDAA